NQNGRITGTAWSHANRNIFACDTSRGVDYVAHAVTVAAATEVVDRAAFVEHAKRENVRAREVDHVNIIANTRAVFGWIIVTIDLDVRTFACRNLQRYRNNVS